MEEKINAVHWRTIGSYTEITMSIQYCKGDGNSCYPQRTSPEYNIGKKVRMQFRALCMEHQNRNLRSDRKQILMVKFSFHNSDSDFVDSSDYRVKINCPDLGIDKACYRINDNLWLSIYENPYGRIQTFTAQIEVITTAGLCCNLKELYEDTDLIDCVLEGDDGSVSVHKTVLASCSPVLRRMVTGPWRESAEGRIKFANTTRSTLEHLKKFIYVHSLPDEGLEQLVLMASMYEIYGMEQRAIDKILNNVTAGRAFNVLEFAFKHELRLLQIGILDRIQKGFISVENMYKQFQQTVEEEKEKSETN